MGFRRRDLLTAGLLAGLPASALAAPRRRPHARPAHRPAAPLPLVMLDPGHGGKDPGCIGLGGTQEKHVVLATALELRRHLLVTGRYRVAMTRATDVFIPLAERVAIAEAQRAALFVSLHANASPDHTARGASVYVFADRASDRRAAAAAARENRAGGAGALPDVPPRVREILSSLMRRETRLHSAGLQHSLVRHLDSALPALSPNARHARFAVLRAPDIASTLVELGFLTNHQDEALLRQPRHRILLANAMARSVDAYFHAVGRAGLISG